MLKLGSSQPWPKAMQMITNSTSKMNAQALLDYFEPLTIWLKKQNQDAGACYGWGYIWPSFYNLNPNRCPTTFVTPATTAQPLVGKFIRSYVFHIQIVGLFQ